MSGVVDVVILLGMRANERVSRIAVEAVREVIEPAR
jgi:hypothetical protein